jgi:hypothetical protein
MKSYNDWKNEQLIKKMSEGMSAAPVPNVPVTVNGDPMNQMGPQQEKPTAGEFFGNTRFAPHLRGRMIQKKKMLGQVGKAL